MQMRKAPGGDDADGRVVSASCPCTAGDADRAGHASTRRLGFHVPANLARHAYIMHTSSMPIDFDPVKAAANDAKHGVSFAEAEAVLSDPMALTREDDAAEGEIRFVPLGLGALGRILVVVWTERGDDFRLISARVATSTERNRYEG